MNSLNEDDNNTEKNNLHYFEKNLKLIKGGLILFLIIVSFGYHLLYKNIEIAHTLLHKQTLKILIDSFIGGIFGVITVYFIWFSRNKFSFTTIPLFTSFIVFIILFLFNLAQEGSGLNRYLDKNNLLNKKGLYYNEYINSYKNDDDKKKIINEINDLEENGDPFEKVSLYIFYIFIFLIILFLSFKMFKYAINNYKFNHFINIPILFHINMNKNIKLIIFLFIIEFIIIIGLNSIPIILSPIIRGEEKKIKFNFSSLFLIFIIILLQLMFQLVGLLKPTI